MKSTGINLMKENIQDVQIPKVENCKSMERRQEGL